MTGALWPECSRMDIEKAILWLACIYLSSVVAKEWSASRESAYCGMVDGLCDM